MNSDKELCLKIPDLVAVARAAARSAGALLMDGQKKGFSVGKKGDVDLITECDREAEALLLGILGEHFTDHTIYAEEGGHASGTSGVTWYVDPLDGTTNFAHGLPWYAVSLGCEIAEEAIVGVVFAPELGWEFWAAKQQGCWLNETPISVSKTPDLDRSLVGTGFPYDRRVALDNNVAEFEAVMRRCQGVRRIGVASLDCAMVAWGRLDAYWEFKLKPWDISAGALLVEEAGGRVTLPDGQLFRSTQGSILATNGLVHNEIMDVLKTKQRSPSSPNANP